MFGAKGDGTTDDYAAFVLMNASAGTNGTVFIGNGTFKIGTNLNITKSVVFSEGGIIKPASGITVTFKGTVSGGAYKIVDTSASGICDFTDASGHSYPEWFGAVADWNGSTGTDNTTAMQNAWVYGTNDLFYSSKARYYIATGLTLTTNRQQNHRGAFGGSFTAGIIFGTGLNFAYKADQPADPYTSTLKYGVQNGVAGSGYPVYFYDMDFDVVDQTTTIAFGMLAATSAALAYNFQFRGGAMRGYAGLHQQWANLNLYTFESFFGYQAALLRSIPSAFGTDAVVQKQTFDTCGFFGTRQSTNYLIYEVNNGSSNVLNSNVFIDPAMEFSGYGLKTEGANYVYITPHIERLSQSTNVLREGSVASSRWIKQDLSGLTGGQTVDFLNGLNLNSVIDQSSGVYTNGQSFSYIYNGVSAYLNATSAGVTGDGTTVTVPFNTIRTQIGSCYNSGTSTWTSSIEGFKLVSASVNISGLASDNTGAYLYIVTGSGQKILLCEYSPYTVSTSGSVTLTGTALIYTAATDTIFIQLEVDGHASKNVNIVGVSSSTSHVTTLSVSDNR